MKNISIMKLALCCSAVIIPAASQAQVTPETQETVDALGAQKAIVDATSIQTDGGPASRPGVSASAGLGQVFRLPELQLLAGDGEASAVISTGFDIMASKPTNGGQRVSRTQFDVKATVPFAKNADDENFFDVKGLSHGTTLSFGFTHTSTKSLSPKQSEASKVVDAARLSCLNINIKMWRKNSDSFRFNELAESQYRSALARYQLNSALNLGMSANGASRDIKNSTSDLKEANFDIIKVQSIALADYITGRCLTSSEGGNAPKSDSELIKKYLTESDAKNYLSGYFSNEPIFFFGAEGKASFDDRSYLDTVNFLKVDNNKVGFGGDAYFGWIDANRNWAVRLTGSYTRSFEAQDDTEICRPLNGGPQQECISGANGAPIKKESAFVVLEGRLVLAKYADGRPKFAIAPEVTYDIDDKDAFFEVPIYFQSNADGGLDGGIRFGYDTEDKDFGVGIFIGVPFSLF